MNQKKITPLNEIIHEYLSKCFAEHPDIKSINNLYETIIIEVEKPLISIVLEENAYNQSRTAKALGINRNTLRKKIQDLKLDVKNKNAF
jgi:two-component system nitrogen regulation response regulator GlnG